MLVGSILFLVICSAGFTPGRADCGVDNTETISLKEPLQEDTDVFQFNTTNDIQITGGSRGYWRIDNQTLYTNRTISLDNDTALCKASDFVLKLDCTNNFKQDLILTVAAVNNHPPVFQWQSITRHVREGMPSGEDVLNIDQDNYATDQDCGDTVRYYGNNTRHMSFVSKTNSVTTNRTFDYEAGDREFNMTVTARDTPRQGDTTAAKEATFTFILMVEDVDDENPAFLHNDYSLHVMEKNSSMAGSWQNSVPPVEARDQDYGINMTVNYSVTGISPTTPNPLLTINATDGRLMVNGTLDREIEDTYRIILKAEQTDNSLRSATSTLTLHVDDINDNRPLFNPVNYNTSIQEHTSAGSNVIGVTAYDIDLRPNNDFSYILLSDTDVFDIDPKSGFIKVRNSTLLDRETTPSFTVTVTTRETEPQIPGTPCNASCNATVTINLLDINDNNPMFVNLSYTFSTNNAVGTEIGQVSATDEDIGENGRIEYTIQDSSYFNVDLNTGNITQTAVVDTGDHQTLKILACDAGQHRRCNSTIVTVTIPKGAVNSTSLTINVTENVAISTVVYIIPAMYTGYLFHINQTFGAFKLSKQTLPAELVTDATIDREIKDSYVIAIDVILVGKINATITLNIRVLDQNDNAPVFNKSSYEFDISDGAAPGSVVGSVQAYDVDEGSNGEVIFNIQGVQSSEQFEIDAVSGQIKLLKAPDLAQEYTELVIVARDNGTVSLKATTAVKVYVGRKAGTVRFFAPAEVEDVRKDQDELIREMSSVLKVTVTFDEIRAVTVPYGPSCAIYLKATAGSSRSSVGSNAVTEDDLRSRVEENYEALLALFSKYQRTSALDENPIILPVIILIAVVAALLLASIIIIAVMCRRNHVLRRQARLVSNLSRQGTIYDTQEVRVIVEDEASVHSLTGSLSTQQLLGDSQPNGNAIGILNPSFNGSSSPRTDENQDTVTQFTHVEDEQEGEIVTEEVILDLNTENSPEQETGERNPDPDYHTVTHDTIPTNPEYVNAVMIEDTVSKADYVNATVLSGELESPTSDIAGPTYAVVNKQGSDAGDRDSQLEEDLPPPPVEQEEVHADITEAREEEEEEEEEDLPPPPPTPPRVRAKGAAEEEELPEESHDEPEPDYAKKVRFSEVKVEVIPEPENEERNEERNGEGEGTETDDEDPAVKRDRPFETIENPADDISDEGTFIMTAL